MTVPSSSPSKHKIKRAKKRPRSDDNGGQSQPKRNKSPGFRVVNGRIYDSENGRTCHQCRQKTMDFVASCKSLRGNKPCTVHICHKCLLNRYGEIAEEVVQSDDWSCPRCRGICNCSFCMKKKGHKPTGMLVRAAKATGCSSASELIQVKGVENLDVYKAVALPKKLVSSKKLIASKKDSKVNSPSKIEADSSFETSIDETWSSTDSTPDSNHRKSRKVNSEPQRSHEMYREGKEGSVLSAKKKSKKAVLDKVSPSPVKLDDKEANSDDGYSQDVVVEKPADNDSARAKNNAFMNPQGIKKCATNLEQAEIGVDLSLPKTKILRTALGIDLSSEDIGHALQFLEFCASFGKACKVSKDLMRSKEKMDNVATPTKRAIIPFSENPTPTPTTPTR